MAFRGWPAEAFEFYEGLEANNSKAYWRAHEQEWKTAVKAPLEELVAELAAEFGEAKISRPYRDLRFSKDKSPYKTSIYAVLGGGAYLSLSASGINAGRGMYMMDAGHLEQYRQAVVDDTTGAELVAAVAVIEKAGLKVESFETLKTAPRGYPKDHPRADLLRRKGLFAWRGWEPAAWMGTKAAKTRIVTALHDAEPLVAWLRANVGEAPAAPTP